MQNKPRICSLKFGEVFPGKCNLAPNLWGRGKTRGISWYSLSPVNQSVESGDREWESSDWDWGSLINSLLWHAWCFGLFLWNGRGCLANMPMPFMSRLSTRALSALTLISGTQLLGRKEFFCLPQCFTSSTSKVSAYFIIIFNNELSWELQKSPNIALFNYGLQLQKSNIGYASFCNFPEYKK